MNKLICPVSLFQQILRRVASEGIVHVAVGLRHAPSDTEWLVRHMHTLSSDKSNIRKVRLFRIVSNPSSIDSWSRVVEGFLILGEEEFGASGMVSVYRWRQEIEPLHQLVLTGSGMHQLSIFDGGKIPIVESDCAIDRFSRTIGGLGGEAIWRRLSRLHVGIIGCGRTGSLVVVTLARLGIRHLTLIDPDLIEAHSLGEMDAVTAADIGRPKVEAVSDHLYDLLAPLPILITPIFASITEPHVLATAQACDILFCCADNDAARLTTAIISSLYHKILVDIGTGIDIETVHHSIKPRNRMMGADVRLILPSSGCLLCWGNLRQYRQAIDDICNHRVPDNFQGVWSEQRSGSLRSLNQMAAGLGVQMVQDLLAERIEESRWARIEFNERGDLMVQYPPQPKITGDCPLCEKAGLGDEMLWKR